MIKPKVVLLIFVSGKIVITGAKVREEIYTAFNQIYTVLAGEWRLAHSAIPGESRAKYTVGIGHQQSSRRNRAL